MIKLRKFLFVLLSAGISASTIAGEVKTTSVCIHDRGCKEISYELRDNIPLVEGDIVLPSKLISDGKGAVVVPKSLGRLWKNGVIPYKISGKLRFHTKLAIQMSIKHWESKTNVRFMEITSDNSNKYPDYVYFVPVPDSTCASHVGRSGGRQYLYLSPRCRTGNIIHEIGHAVGFWHEQSRADRDNYIKILWDNIDKSHRYNFNQHIKDGADIGEYDYGSIMHYQMKAFSKNGQITILPLYLGAKIGQRKGLSKKDIASAKIMYPKS